VLAHDVAEVIVVDDGSTDGTAQIAGGLPSLVRFVRRDHQGGAQALNHGIALASRELIAFLDADDLWLPGKLALQRATLDADPALDMVFGHMRQFISPELPDDIKSRLVCPEEPQPGHLISSLLARRSVFERVGPLATDLRTGWFIDWSMRAADQGIRHRMLPEVVLARRLHDGNLGHRERTGYLEVVRRNLMRRREAAK
jgi:glycosyltransferase involved in cell wall biosynthesis